MLHKWFLFLVAKKLQDLAIWLVPLFRAVFPDLAPHSNVVVALDATALETIALDATALDAAPSAEEWSVVFMDLILLL